MLEWIVLGTMAAILGTIIIWAFAQALVTGRADKIDRLRRELNRLERAEGYKFSKKKGLNNALSTQTKIYDTDDDSSDYGDSDSSDGDGGGGDSSD